MKRFQPKLMAGVAVLLLFFVTVFAWAATKSYRVMGRNLKFTKDVWLLGEEKRTATDVSLTSPTVTFSADDGSVFNITSNVAQAGVRPINGELGQRIIIRNAGAQTITLTDNATTFSLGGNIALATDDVAELECLEEIGTNSRDRWGCLSVHDN